MMNNSPLKPLFWEDSADRSEAKHEFVNYRVIPDHDSFGKFAVRYKDSNSQPATGFATIEDAKAWAQDNYNGKMQPYVKPAPTWIDVNERLPNDLSRCLVIHQNTSRRMNKNPSINIDWYDASNESWAFFKSGIMQEVTHWMPLPELPKMEKELTS